MWGRKIEWFYENGLQISLFSSPELKAQVSYSDRLLSIVRLTFGV
jgi:hypothetical protein